MMKRAAGPLRQTWTLAAHDVGQWRRAPWAIAAALIPPAALALLLYILTFNLGHQPIALVQEGHGRYSNHIAGIFQAQAGDIYSLINTDQAIIDLRNSVKNAARAQLENGVITSNDYLREVNAEDQARQTLIVHQLQLLQAQINYQNILGK